MDLFLLAMLATLAIVGAVVSPPAEVAPYTRQSLADRWGVHPSTIDNWIRDGKLHAVRLVHAVRIPAEEVARVEREGLPR